MLPRVTQVTAKDNYLLKLLFSNGEKREFSVKPYLDYRVYKSLQEKTFFNSVYTQNGTVCWGENDIDFDPDTLYMESVVID